MTIRDYPIAIIGAGPVGMAAAAHLAERNISFMIFESGESVGANLLDWGHVRVFSPWRYNIDKAAERLLFDIGWSKPNEDGLPTGEELVKQYLLPLSFHPNIEPFLHLSSKVISITRKGLDKVRTANRDKVPFVVKVKSQETYRSFECSGIIDSSGTWNNPNPIGVGGVWATGELENQHKIVYRIPDIMNQDKVKYAGKKVLVIGGGHSAINTLLDLAKLKAKYPTTELHWALHTEKLEQIYGGKEADALEARGALGTKIEQLVNSGQLFIHTPYYIHELQAQGETVTVTGYINQTLTKINGIEEIIANTGARPDLSILREVRVQVDSSLECVPELAELIDPNIHSCGTVRPHGELELQQPEHNFYVVGIKSYGRAPTFLMATGYEQVRSIAAWLDGDIEAARRVELDLPETGVCSSNNLDGAACCGSESSSSNKEEKGTGCCSPAKSVHKTENSNQLETVTNTQFEKQVITKASSCCGSAIITKENAPSVFNETKINVNETDKRYNQVHVPSSAKKSSCCG